MTLVFNLTFYAISFFDTTFAPRFGSSKYDQKKKIRIMPGIDPLCYSYFELFTGPDDLSFTGTLKKNIFKLLQH